MSALLTLNEASSDPTLWDICQCGGRAILIQNADGMAFAICDECPIGTDSLSTPSEVVQAWNIAQRMVAQ